MPPMADCAPRNRALRAPIRTNTTPTHRSAAIKQLRSTTLHPFVIVIVSGNRKLNRMIRSWRGVVGVARYAHVWSHQRLSRRGISRSAKDGEEGSFPSPPGRFLFVLKFAFRRIRDKQCCLPAASHFRDTPSHELNPNGSHSGAFEAD